MSMTLPWKRSNSHRLRNGGNMAARTNDSSMSPASKFIYSVIFFILALNQEWVWPFYRPVVYPRNAVTLNPAAINSPSSLQRDLPPPPISPLPVCRMPWDYEMKAAAWPKSRDCTKAVAGLIKTFDRWCNQSVASCPLTGAEMDRRTLTSRLDAQPPPTHSDGLRSTLFTCKPSIVNLHRYIGRNSLHRPLPGEAREALATHHTGWPSQCGA